VLERGARQRGLLLTDSAAGDLVVTGPGTDKVGDRLVQGGEDGNIKSCSGSVSMAGRFSSIQVNAQADYQFGNSEKFTTHQKAVVSDGAVGRYRPLVITAETQGKPDVLARRAQHERAVRVGRSRRLTYAVQGWRHSGGLWEPNKLVYVDDAYLGIRAWLLIVAVSYILGESGTESKITVMPQGAFNVLAEPEPMQAEGFGFNGE